MTLWQPTGNEKVPIPGSVLGGITINQNAMKKQKIIIPSGNFKASNGFLIISGFLSMLFHHLFFMYR